MFAEEEHVNKTHAERKGFCVVVQSVEIAFRGDPPGRKTAGANEWRESAIGECVRACSFAVQY